MLDAGEMSTPMSPVSDAARPLDRAIAREAAQWLMRLHSGEASDNDVLACQRWRVANPEHECAWQRAQRINQKLGLVPHEIGMPALNRLQRVDRRAMLKTWVLAMTIAPASYLAWHQSVEELGGEWLAQWTADYKTATGERRDIALVDGTRVWINTDSAIDVVFDESQRRVILRNGEILIETGPDSGNPSTIQRPFIVETEHGRIRALGTRFVVRLMQGRRAETRTEVLQGAVEIRPNAAAHQAMVIQAGQQAFFTATSVDTPKFAAPHTSDWSRGVLFAKNQRLDDFVAELSRYRPGVLRCDPSVAGLRISGAFQLNNTDNVLAALPDTLPVEVFYRSRWLVTIIAPKTQSDG